jgi:hypothetical protein
MLTAVTQRQHLQSYLTVTRLQWNRDYEMKHSHYKYKLKKYTVETSQ